MEKFVSVRYKKVDYTVQPHRIRKIHSQTQHNNWDKGALCGTICYYTNFYYNYYDCTAISLGINKASWIWILMVINMIVSSRLSIYLFIYYFSSRECLLYRGNTFLLSSYCFFSRARLNLLEAGGFVYVELSVERKTFPAGSCQRSAERSV